MKTKKKKKLIFLTQSKFQKTLNDHGHGVVKYNEYKTNF